MLGWFMLEVVILISILLCFGLGCGCFVSFSMLGVLNLVILMVFMVRIVLGLELDGMFVCMVWMFCWCCCVV